MFVVRSLKLEIASHHTTSARPTKGSLKAQTQYLSICLSVAMQILKRYRSFYSLRRLCNICQEDSKPFQCFFEHMKPAVKNSSWIGNVTMTVLFLATFHERYFGFFPQRFFFIINHCFMALSDIKMPCVWSQIQRQSSLSNFAVQAQLLDDSQLPELF